VKEHIMGEWGLTPRKREIWSQKERLLNETKELLRSMKSAESVRKRGTTIDMGKNILKFEETGGILRGSNSRLNNAQEYKSRQLKL